MLVLTRCVGQKVIAAGNIEFVILGINGGQVRVGVKAPAGVVIDREEIHERKQREKGNAA